MLAGVVLAAGASRRLGRPKQLVRVRGVALVNEVAGCARAVCDRVAVVLGAHAAQIAPALDGLDVEPVDNADWREGVASSIRAGVAWAERAGADALLLLVCDQLRLGRAHLAAIADAHRATGGAVASRYARRLGVPALFPRAQLAALAGLRGDAGARAVLAGLAEVVAIDWPDGELDLDVPAQLADLYLP